MFHYFAVYKPYMMICQFTPENYGDVTLSDLGFDIPKDCYSVGRLDKDSEGLLLISNDNLLKTKFLNPQFNHHKTYLAQVEGAATNESIADLRKGVEISIDGKKYKTLPAAVEVLTDEPFLPPRNPPIRFRASIPTTWIKITITEGKNRQVRKMCAAVGFPVLRLVRHSLEDLELADLKNGKFSTFDKKSIYEKLNIR